MVRGAIHACIVVEDGAVGPVTCTARRELAEIRSRGVSTSRFISKRQGYHLCTCRSPFEDDLSSRIDQAIRPCVTRVKDGPMTWKKTGSISSSNPHGIDIREVSKRMAPMCKKFQKANDALRVTKVTGMRPPKLLTVSVQVVRIVRQVS